ncbi:MAG: hypothetical protein DSY88_04765 [Candidatus Poseidoniales archaeon]|nr:MAG: hypothetical protein DSY88_04765 [Candidatus Poseidoniales archaeon]
MWNVLLDARVGRNRFKLILHPGMSQGQERPNRVIRQYVHCNLCEALLARLPGKAERHQRPRIIAFVEILRAILPRLPQQWAYPMMVVWFWIRRRIELCICSMNCVIDLPEQRNCFRDERVICDSEILIESAS